ncbi:PREDICTED: calcitonin-like [Thamnophis sirtalis]|uniref:Calcitonin-like n=1 Tax=Thamnophis sirtalis TaxID=35019 RepID=A0A6I9YRD2_9SAUR|nr:PREDICTED: calcitonin-like [Thamnophis sirtalis]
MATCLASRAARPKVESGVEIAQACCLGERRSAAPRKAAAFRAHLSSCRGGFEPVTDRGALGDYEARRLLNALVKEYVQMTAEDPDQGSEGSSLDRPIAKRCANLSTCVLGKLSQELHKLQTYPRTDVGAGTPGKKRNVLSELENERYANY